MSSKPLRNPRHEAFARHYVRLGVARRAYVEAGYQSRMPVELTECGPVDACASRLLKHAKVESRIERLRQAMAKRSDVTEESLLDELEEARIVSRDNGQGAAMTSASVAKAKLVGLMVDRKEIGDAGEFQRMTEQELREYIKGNDMPAPIGPESLPAPTHPGSKSEQ